MIQKIPCLRRSLTLQLIVWVGLILVCTIFTWAYVSIEDYKTNALRHVVEDADRLGNTIRLGAHYAMTLNSRDDINQIISNIARQPGIMNIRIFNKEGQIKFSNAQAEVETKTDISANACSICHEAKPPLVMVNLEERVRISESSEHAGEKSRLLGIISPIYNENGCSTAACHYHPEEKKILGALDVVVSLDKMDREILTHEKGIFAMAFFTFLGIAAIISFFFFRFVKRPVHRLIMATRSMGEGNYTHQIDLGREDEIGQLASAIARMSREIERKQTELNRQRDEYQSLFEQVPCYITVQDKDLKVLKYNSETAVEFAPSQGDYCYQAYKGRLDRCEVCPVLQTFEDGQCHVGEELVLNKDGTETYWFVRTSPIRKSHEEITAVMEISLDITQAKRLEKEIRVSEVKYHTIFNNIPNAVFIVNMESMAILDCNDSAATMYGFERDELIERTIIGLFDESDRESCHRQLRSFRSINQVRQITKTGRTLFVSIYVSASEYLGCPALLVVASDITQRLMVEQQLIQAGKMATLGEMSAGVAHELNQPLSVIKTACSYLMKKVKKGQRIEDEILKTMAEEIDSHVDRASKIINHLREFGRKSDVRKEPVQVNEALNRACEMFYQQFKLRMIRIVKEAQEDLPLIFADLNRLEQVFINLLMNGRDAIEEKCERQGYKNGCNDILLRSYAENGAVVVEVRDSGIGIPEHVRTKIFEPFFTTKKVGQGTGLGLSISYGIVQDYEGTLAVESKENEGTVFIIRFPVAAGG